MIDPYRTPQFPTPPPPITWRLRALAWIKDGEHIRHIITSLGLILCLAGVVYVAPKGCAQQKAWRAASRAEMERRCDRDAAEMHLPCIPESVRHRPRVIDGCECALPNGQWMNFRPNE